ncbi:MAG: elongation factor G [Chloroflexi bacterium]|nr:elongation factor G [Chloroflexota bacterium]|tara:strand:- start:38007 stop:40031 length:2025 start_codon:yes stop_codon:yes gene_type:complete
MASISSDLIRNVVFLSHSSAGKTILSEAAIHISGAISRLGTILDGNTVSDHEPEEIKRQSSVQTSIVPCDWRNNKINIIDSPGYSDFRGEVMSALSVADSSILVVSASSGVEVGTIQMWDLSEEQKLPQCIFINKLERENTDFNAVVDEIIEKFGRKCVPIQIPNGAENSFTKAINLLGKNEDSSDQNFIDAKEKLIEVIAETDDDLTLKYLEGEEISSSELLLALKSAVKSRSIIPVLVGSAINEVGVTELLDSIVDLMPSPVESDVRILAEGANDDAVEPKSNILSSFVFKTTADPFVGKLSYVRVYSGVLNSDSSIWNSKQSKNERVGQLYVMVGKEQKPVSELVAGDIGAVAKMASTLTSDTISVKENSIQFKDIFFPDPIHKMAVSPKTKSDLDKITSSLNKIVEEDPSLNLSRNNDTLELLLGGLGDVHIDISLEKIKRKFGVEIESKFPKVAYKETVGNLAKAEYRHKKQSGGHGQFAHVCLEVEPLSRGSGFQFTDKVVGGAVPKEYIPSVEKGCNKAIGNGVISGFPVVDLKVTLYDGSFHPVDSSGICFEIAGEHAFSDCVKQANPVLLEPVMKIAVTVPDLDTGDVISDLNGKRAKILGMEPNGNGTTIINAEAPQSELLRYSMDLRSVTQGRGTFAMEFDHYEDVPAHLFQKLVEQMNENSN